MVLNYLLSGQGAEQAVGKAVMLTKLASSWNLLDFPPEVAVSTVACHVYGYSFKALL